MKRLRVSGWRANKYSFNTSLIAISISINSAENWIKANDEPRSTKDEWWKSLRSISFKMGKMHSFDVRRSLVLVPIRPAVFLLEDALI